MKGLSFGPLKHLGFGLDDGGRFRDDLPFFGGKAILKPNGKEGNVSQRRCD